MPILVFLSLFVVKKWRNGLKMKLGLLDEQVFKPHPVWFHAVSVGELNALIPLLSYFNGMNIVLSTSTKTAQEMAKKKLKDEIESGSITLIYMPWDHPLIVSSVINKINPSLLVLMETEIWPALIDKADQKNIPVAIVNARLADKSFKAYHSFRFFFKWIFSKISLVLAQSPSDSRKFIALGLDKAKVYMTGNIKFAVFPALTKEKSLELRQQLGYSSDDLIFICASTHEEEEAGLINIFQELYEEHQNLRLILAPRHPERFKVVEDLILSAAKLELIRLSEKSFKPMTKEDVLLIDTIGDLTSLLSIADIAFVGGTIVDHVGGHNVLEPAVYGAAVVIGDNYYKNTETVEMMQGANAISVCESLYDLRLELEELITNLDRRIIMGTNAQALVNQNKKIILDTARKLKELLYEAQV